MSGGALSPRDMEKARSQPDTALRTHFLKQFYEEKNLTFFVFFFF